MKRATTDAQASIAAGEFVWSEEGLSDAHSYLLPTLKHWLRASGAKRILDLGCGNGALTDELTKAGWSMVGMDSSESGISITTKTYPQTEFICAAIGDPLPARLQGRFDAVIAVEVIEHLLLPRSLFARAEEALAGQGALLVTTPYHGYLKNLAIALANGFDAHWHPLRDYGHVKFFSRPTISQLFEEQGFAVERFSRVGRLAPLAKSMIVMGTRRSS